MISYLLKRTFQSIFILFGVVSIIFVLFFMVPGDPVSMMAGQRTDEATKDAIRKEFGLDRPLHQRYFYYLNDLSPISVHKDFTGITDKYNGYKIASPGDKAILLKMPYLRRSYQSNKKVSDILINYIPGTLILALTAMLFASVIGVVLGVLAALRPNSIWDRWLVFTSVLGISVPSFVAGIIIALIFGYYLNSLTGLDMTGYIIAYDPFEGKYLEWKNLILPALTLGIRPVAIIAQLTRSSMLEVMAQDYIRTARAKGLSSSTILFRHALRNAMNPVVTAITGWLASLFAGTFFVEKIFSWKGLGYLTIDAVEKMDLPVVMGSALFIALAFVIINALVDVMYTWLDPRVKLE